jgi:hypothetical protein
LLINKTNFPLHLMKEEEYSLINATSHSKNILQSNLQNSATNGSTKYEGHADNVLSDRTGKLEK